MRHKYIDMEYKKFENHMADVLRHDQAEIDIDAFILDLHKPKKHRRYPVWWWVSSIMLTAIVGGAIYLSEGEAPQANKYVHNSNKTNASDDIYTKSTVTTGQSAISTNDISNQLNNIPNPQSVTDTKSHQIVSRISSESHINGTRKSKKNVIPSYSNTSQPNSKKSKGFENFITVPNADTRNPNSQIGSIPDGQTTLNLQNTLASKGLVNISPLAFSPENLSSSFLGKIKSGNVICPTFQKKGKFALDIIPEIGYFRPLKRLEYDGNEPNNIYDLRNQYESTLEGLNAGLYARVSNDKFPLFFQIGTSFSRMTEKMPLDYSYTKRDTTRGIISITQSQSGDTVTVIYGDIIHENKISGRKISHHHFTMVDVPVSLGFEKSFGQWSAGVEGGISINLALRASGQILASDTSFTAIDQPVEAYKNRLGLNYFGGLFVSRSFDRAGKFYLSVRGRYIPDSFSSDYNRIRQSYHILGLNVGYLYSF